MPEPCRKSICLACLGYLLPVLAALSASIHLEWDPPARTNGISGYKLLAYQGIDYVNTWDAHTNTTFTIDGLPPGEYAIAAVSYTTNGIESPWSNQVLAIVPEAPMLRLRAVLERSTNLLNWSTHTVIGEFLAGDLTTGYFRVRLSEPSAPHNAQQP